MERGELNRGEYAALLSRMAGYYFAVARRIPMEPLRLQFLRRDLTVVGAPPPPDVDLPPVEDEARRLGWRYVVEGSVFGGRVIYRQLDYLFGEEEAGRSFFRGAASGARHWQALCSELENAASTPGAVEEMIEGALDAFAAFEDVMGAAELAHA
mgnify:FL=1